MRIIIGIISAMLLLSVFNHLQAAEKGSSEMILTQARQTVVTPFFDALKNGDVMSIKAYLSEDLYDEYWVLLEKNLEYPQFLINYYQGAVFQIKQMTLIKDSINCQVDIEWADGSTTPVQLQIAVNENPSGDERSGRFEIQEFNQQGQAGGHLNEIRE